MNSSTDYQEDLKVIKKIMEESSRFLSLSGLSGIFAGIVAFAGFFIAVYGFLDGEFIISAGSFRSAAELQLLKVKLIADALVILVIALGLSVYFSWRKSVRKGTGIWTPVSRRMLVNLIVPLASGGVLIFILLLQDQYMLIIPTMLIFYGLALVSAGKFTYGEVFYLGLLEIITGLAAALWPAFGLLLWAFGFGLLHIIYGLIMFRKYE